MSLFSLQKTIWLPQTSESEPFPAESVGDHYSATDPPVSMPPLPMLPVRDVETQTESELLAPPLDSEDWPDVGLTRNRHSGVPPIIDLDDEEVTVGDTPRAVEAQGPPLDWKGRCLKLEKINEELERERVKLAETRLHLELQLQKLKGN